MEHDLNKEELNKTEFSIGFTGCYINDYKFDHLCELPVEAAVEWVKKACPKAMMSTYKKAEELTLNGDNESDARCNGWLNKLFVIVGNDHDKWVALYNHDGKFSVRIKG